MRKWSQKEVKQLAQGHTAAMCQNRDLKPAPEIRLFTSASAYFSGRGK